MKIAYISDLSPPKKIGGAEAVMSIEATEMARRGHDVNIITLGPYPEHTTNHVAGEPTISTKFVGKGVWDIYTNASGTNKLMTAALAAYNPFFSHRLKTILEDLAPDIVHSHFIHRISYGSIARALSNESHWVHTFHDYLFECPKGSLIKGSGATCDNPRRLCLTRNEIFRYFLGRPHALIAISNYVRKRLITAGFEERTISLIPNPVSLGNFFTNDDCSEPFLLFVGRLEQCKGIVEFAEEISKVEDASIRLVVVGSGPMKEKLMHMSARSIPTIDVLGRISDDHLRELYSTCRAVIFPSLWPEVLPLVPLEAFSFGKPVIASSTGGTLDIVHDNIDGYLIQPEDHKLMVDKSLELLRDEARARRMGGKGRESAKCYSVERHMTSLTNLYNSLISR